MDRWPLSRHRLTARAALALLAGRAGVTMHSAFPTSLHYQNPELTPAQMFLPSGQVLIDDWALTEDRWSAVQWTWPTDYVRTESGTFQKTAHAAEDGVSAKPTWAELSDWFDLWDMNEARSWFDIKSAFSVYCGQSRDVAAEAVRRQYSYGDLTAARAREIATALTELAGLAEVACQIVRTRVESMGAAWLADDGLLGEDATDADIQAARLRSYISVVDYLQPSLLDPAMAAELTALLTPTDDEEADT